ncbi:MAG: zinc ribbon domain-containing protein [Desulfobacterales bacterium]|jgi:ribosomal protein L37AE/L43A
MAFETKEEVLEKIMNQEKPRCPQCDQEMSIWEVPLVAFGDGLGWGVPYLFVCFNDDCPTYKSGWEHMKETYGSNSSYRTMCYPGPGPQNYECIPVFSSMGGQGQVVDEELQAQQEALKEAIKRGFSILAGCYTSKDWLTVSRILLDPTEPVRVRVKAAEMIGDFGELEVVEPLRNLKFGNEILQKKVDSAIGQIHLRSFTRECPFCAEIIKKRASVCKHCGKDVAGL